MKKSLAYLPKNKRDDLERIVATILESCDDVEMIILFGSYARGDWKEEADLKPERKSGHKSDYDILAVTKEKSTAENTGIWKSITGKALKMGLSTHVRIVAHDIQDVNIKLAEGQYFYTDVKKEGCLLYDSGNFKLARKRKLKPEEKKRIAQDYYNHWFDKANVFFEDFESNLRKHSKGQKYLSQAAFNLHQTAEASYKTILLVFTNYNPNEHLLGLLGSMAAKHNRAIKNIFPKKTKREEKLFELLDYAYIGARYDPRYRIEKEDLEYLSERVRILLELTERICLKKIEGFL
ncbi:MAG TPA: HEPN domain-containing protein [bacterium]|nr:HEPN domain-containing protein [bacterium]